MFIVEKRELLEIYNILTNKKGTSLNKNQLRAKIIDIYKYDPEKIMDVLVFTEIILLKSIYKGEANGLVNPRFEAAALTIDGKPVEEIKNIVLEVLDEIITNKEEYLPMFYYKAAILGLIRSYGALRIDEFARIFKKLMGVHCSFQDLCLRASTYIDEEKEIIYLKTVSHCYEKIVATQSKKIKTLYDLEYILNMGAYFIEFSEKIENSFETYYIRERVMVDLLTDDKCDLFYLSQAGYYSKEILPYLFDMIPKLKSYYLNEKRHDIVSKEDTDLFYSIVLDYIAFLGGKYRIDVKIGNSFDSQASSDVLDKERENNFRYTNLFLHRTVYSKEQKEVIMNLTKGISGMFTIVKFTKNGAIFADEDNKLYLVKGLITPLDKMFEESQLPLICATTIMNLNGNIVTNGLITTHNLVLGPNIRKMTLDEYNKNKNNIIKLL